MESLLPTEDFAEFPIRGEPSKKIKLNLPELIYFEIFLLILAIQ